MDKGIYVEFRVCVRDREYSYQATRQGAAELSALVSRPILENIDVGNLLIGLLNAALIEFDQPEESESEG